MKDQRDIVPQSERCTQKCVFYDYERNSRLLKELPDYAEDSLPDRPSQAEQLYTVINDWQTRVLALQPGSLGEPLKADLCVVDLIHASVVIIHTKQTKIQ